MMRRLGLPALLLGAILPAQDAAVPSAKLAVRTIPPDFVFHFTPRVEIPGRPSVSLVLSGGGARGLAHIGVLQRLDEGGYPIDSIVGTSAGALTGALYACGFSGREIEALFQRVDFSRAFLDPLVRTPGKTLEEQEAENGTLLGMQIQGGLPSIALGLRSGREVQHTLEGLLARGAYFSGGDFDRLKVPLRVLATNLETGQGRLFARGDMVEVLRAAMAVPGAFKPVVIENQQYVDGALVENIPVFQSKEAFHPQVLLAVDVSNPMEKRYASNFLSVASRSLDLVIEQRQRESAAAANLVLRPDIRVGGFTEYGGQLPEMVEAGARAFREREAEYRRLLLDQVTEDEELPARRLEIRNPVPVDPGLTRVIQVLLPEGQPFRRRNVMVAMQQAIVRGWLKDLKAEVVALEGAENLLRLEFIPFEPVRELQVDAPEPLRESMLRDLRSEFPLGERFNPQRLGAFLGRWVHALILNGMPLLDVRGSGFDDATGRLRVVAREPVLGALAVRGAASSAEEGYLRGLMRPLLDQPVRTAQLRQRLDLAVERLRLSELRYQLRPRSEGDGVELVLSLVHDQPHSLDLGLGWESTLGGQVGLRYRTLNLGMPGWELVVEGAKNGLQRGASVGLTGPFQSMPGAGLELKGTIFEQRLGVPLYFQAPEAPVDSLDLRIRTTDGSFGAFARFGNLGQGRVSLTGAFRRAQFLQRVDLGEHRERSGELAMEWDDFDRHTFPRDGLLLRGFYAAGETVSGLEPRGNFRMAYVRARGLASLGPGKAERQLGADLDVEWGYGDRLPLDRWWTLGGSSFLVGSKPLGFLSPNFLVGRFGLPLRMNGPYGLSLQVIPRFDYGVIGKDSRDLFRGLRGQGTGILVRTMVVKFYVELSYGFLKLYDPVQGWTPATGTFNALIGTQPFDLWKRR